MKKWQILIPSVMVASTPLIALTGCNKEDSIKFTADNGQSSGAQLYFQIHWDKTKHSLDFPTGSIFHWQNGKMNTPVSIFQTEIGTATVMGSSIAPPISSDITDGYLTLIYRDKTAKTGKKTKTIKGINIAYQPLKK